MISTSGNNYSKRGFQIISIVALVLIFFTVLSLMVMPPSSPDGITISADGHIRLKALKNSYSFEVASLPAFADALKSEIAQYPAMSLRIRADRQVHYGFLREVFATLGQTGVESVVLTDKTNASAKSKKETLIYLPASKQLDELLGKELFTPIIINIRSDGSIELNSMTYYSADDKELNALRAWFEEINERFGNEILVIVRSEAQAPYGRIVDVFHIAAESGYKMLTFDIPSRYQTLPSMKLFEISQ